MDFKYKSIVTVTTCIIFILLAYTLSDTIPFHGDEFYTLDIKNIPKPILYKIIISWYMEGIEVGSDSIFLLRFSSIIFALLGISFYLWHIPKNFNELILASLLLLSNSFILMDSVLFRYYSFYFLTSVLFFIYIFRWSKGLSTNTNIFISITGLIICPYLFFILSTLQFVFYLIFLIMIQKIKSIEYRLIFGGSLLLVSILLLIFPKIIWVLFDTFKISNHMEIDINSILVRGISFSTIIKPIYALFQMIFGYNVTPSESFIIITLFLIILIGYCYVCFLLTKKQGLDLFLILFSTIFMPFIMVYFFFEPLSFPGFTQFESKHGLLLLPLILFLSMKSISLMSPKIYTPFLIVLFTSQLFGIKKTYNVRNADWYKILSKIESTYNEEKCSIIIDGRSINNIKFYKKDILRKFNLFYTWEGADVLKEKVNKRDEVILLLNDYKSYTSLSLEQNWNSGSDSYNKFTGLDSILDWLNNEYVLEDSYVNYPTFLYLLNRNKPPDIGKTFGVWEHHLKDLILPIKGSIDKVLYSSVLIKPGDSTTILSDSNLFINLENSSNVMDGTMIGKIVSNEKIIPLIKGENTWDIFSEFNNENIDNARTYHSWYHSPLVSGSIKYSGSYYKHKAHIYILYLGDITGSELKVLNESKISSIRIWK